MMKKAILSFLVLLISPLLPAVCDASYIIHLKNGGRFLTPQFWEEDNYVKFYIAGGIMGIEKKSVRKTEQSTLDLNDIDEVKKPEKRPAQAEPRTPIPSVPKKEEKETAKDDTKKDPTIIRVFKALIVRFESSKKMSIDQLNELKKELTALGDAIVSNHSEEDYLKEVGKITQMKFFLNDLLLRKSKNR